MSNDKANAPLLIVVGTTREGFFVDPIDTISDSANGIISPDVLKRRFLIGGDEAADDYVRSSHLRPAYRSVMIGMGLNEHAIGISRMDNGVSYMSFDVAELYWHRRMDYVLMVIDLVREFTGRPVEVFLVTKNWTTEEVAQLERLYPDTSLAAKFDDLKPLLYAREHLPTA